MINKLQLGTSLVMTDSDAEYSGLSIAIDGTSLFTLVGEAELPFAEREGAPQMAGNYVWCPAREILSNLRLALREPLPCRRRVMLGQCSCGDVDCWSLWAEVEVVGEAVVWNDFSQPRRGPRSLAGFWDLGPQLTFKFDAGEYAEELLRVWRLI